MTGSKGEATRSHIVACASALFYQRGYEATSFSDIVQASGLHRGNIYHYFKAKDDILAAVVSFRLNEFRALLAQWETTYADPRERLAAFVDMIAGRAPELALYGCPIGSLNTELGKDRCELQGQARALFDLFRDWLRACFEEFGRGTESAALATHLLGRAQGIAVLGHVYRDADWVRTEARLLREWILAL